MAKYAVVVKEKCIACGSCAATAPDIFDFDGDGLAEVIYNGDGNQGVTVIDIEDELNDAVESCPTSCIKVKSAPFN